MDLQKFPIKKTALNPLWIISIFFTFTESMLGYAVFKTNSVIQIILTIFVILFPTFVSTMFFIIVWNRPKHLYAPTDYQTDQSFLESFNIPKTADNLSKQIENTVNENLASEKIIAELQTGKNAKAVLKEAAESIVTQIKKDNFITVDLSKFTKTSDSIVTFAYDDLKTFNDLTDQVFFELRSRVRISIFSYGYEWVLKHEDSGKIIKGARIITGTPQGDYLNDNRTLDEVGINRGDRLFVDKPDIIIKKFTQK